METNAEVVKAIHELEMRLNQAMNNNTIALEVNNERLQNLKEAVDRHAHVLYGHEENDHPGLITRLATLEKADKHRNVMLGTILTAAVGMIVKMAYDFISMV